MKYIVVLGDGMAGRPLSEYGGKTVLELANTPNMDCLARKGNTGTVKTVPDNMAPGSDTANLSVMGYAPENFYSGRSPLEAVSMGIKLKDTDVTFRCNLVTLSETENYEDAVMLDYSSGEITTGEAKELISFLALKLNTESMKLYSGISYRHCLVMNNAQTGGKFTPPHDITGKPIKDYLPKGVNGDMLLELQKKSKELLKDHPINLSRIKRGLNPATSCWFWGEGTKPRLESFQKMHGVNGAVISAVDLIKGIGICADLKVLEVEGATGNYDTNFKGKAEAAIKALREDCDFVYIHMEAPDECGHHGDIKNKIMSVELIDKEVLGRIMKEFEGEDYAVLILPDHPTPIEIRTHSSDPVPFVMFDSRKEGIYKAKAYSEKEALETGYYVEKGSELMTLFIE